MERAKKPTTPEKYIERWEIEWDYGPVVYGCYPLHRTFASAMREVQKMGTKDAGYKELRLEEVTIKRVKVPA